MYVYSLVYIYVHTYFAGNLTDASANTVTNTKDKAAPFDMRTTRHQVRSLQTK